MSNHTVDNQPSLPARPSQQPVKNDSALAVNQPVQSQARAARQSDVNENDQSSSSTDSPRHGRGRPRKQQELANVREDEHAAVASENDQSSSSMDPPQRGRGRPRKQEQPVHQRLFQRELNDTPVTAPRLLSAHGRQTVITRPRRCRSKRPRVEEKDQNEQPKHKYVKISDEQANFVLQRRVNQGLDVATVQQEFHELYAFQIDRDQVYKIIQRARKRDGSVKKHKSKGAAPTYTDEDKQWFIEHRCEHPMDTGRVVRHEFVQWRAAQLRPVADPNRCLSDAQQTRWKKDSLITRKKVNVEPEIRNDESHIQERREYAAMAIRWLDDTVIYIDEAGYNRELHAAAGYAVVGDPVIATGLSQKGLNLNVIAAMTPHEMLYWECSFESTDANRYAKFIDSMIRSNPNLFNNEHCHLVHDGVPFHKSPQVLEVLDIQRLQHFFHVIPAYSPSLNAIENAWKVVRDNARARFSELLDRSISLQQLIEDSIRSVTKEQCRGFHKGVKDALASCLEERPLSMNSSSVEFSIRDRPLRFQGVEESADSQQRDDLDTESD